MTAPLRDPLVVPLAPEHARGVLAVYAEGIATGAATFETHVPAWDDWDRAHCAEHRFVALAAPGDGTPDGAGDGGAVLGWVAVSPVSRRAAYRGVVEHSVYVAARARGRGVGGALLARLTASCDAGAVWTLQSSVLAHNVASLSLHDRFGFRRVGVRERIAQRDGHWYDVVLLERRSRVVGV